MKHRVGLSLSSVAVTFGVTVILIFCLYVSYPSPIFLLMCVITILLYVFAMWYAPMAISVDAKNIEIVAPLHIRVLPLSDVESVAICSGTPATVRLCGSGGFLGYWGIFSDPIVGKFFAYYGKRSECFLVRMKNGNKYMLGCENAPQLVEYICNQLTLRATVNGE